jgi:hypothetical protein
VFFDDGAFVNIALLRHDPSRPAGTQVIPLPINPWYGALPLRRGDACVALSCCPEVLVTVYETAQTQIEYD